MFAAIVLLVAAQSRAQAWPDAPPRMPEAPVAPAHESRALGAPRAGELTGAATGSESGSRLGGSMVQTGGALMLVVGLMFAAARIFQYISRRSGLAGAIGAGGRAPAGLLEVLGRYPIGRGQTLVLLRVDNRVLLLAQSGGGLRFRGGSSSLTTLCEMDSPEDVASILLKTRDADQESLAAKFRHMLGRFDQDAGGDAPAVVDLTRTPRSAGRKLLRGAAGDVIELWDEQSSGPDSEGATAGARSGLGLRGRLASLRTAGGGAR